MPPIDVAFPEVTSRIGVDLNVLDVNNADDADWLDALIWPELTERRAWLHAAIAEAKAHPATLVQGDAIKDLPQLAAGISAEIPLIIYHSFVMYQLSAEQRNQFQQTLAAIAQTRPQLYAINAGWIGTPTPDLWLDAWQNGQHTRTKLANMDAHGRWLQWLV